MKGFYFRCQIDTKERVGVGYRNKRYAEYMANASGIKVRILVKAEDLKPGDIISTVCARLIGITVPKSYVKEICILIREYELEGVSSDLPNSGYVDVIAYGNLVKTERSVYRKVGTRGSEFIACSLRLENYGEGEKTVFMVAFEEEAKLIASLSDGTPLRVEARLRKCRSSEDFELNVTRVRINKAGKEEVRDAKY